MASSGSRGFGWQSGEPPQVPDHELLCRIGGGSYGEVWLARSALGALRAVKIVHRERFEKERPYEREFEGLLHFEPISRGHEGLVDVLQVGRTENCFYCVMELADAANNEAAVERAKFPTSGKAQVPWHTTARTPTEGEGQNTPNDGRAPTGHREDAATISKEPAPTDYVPLTLDTLAEKSGRLSAKECVNIGLSLALALKYLHERGLVHRDIKPSNIIFVDGVPKLADVGLVAKAEAGLSFVGTEGFVPPEGPGTAQADIYSLGKVLYEIAMGKDRLSFPSPPSALEELPQKGDLLDLNEVILKACQPDPKQRYRSASEMARDLQLLAEGHSLREHKKLHRRMAWLGGSLAAAVVFGAYALAQRLLVAETPAPALIVAGKFSLANNTSAELSKLCNFAGDEEPELVTVAATTGTILVTDLKGQKVRDWAVPAYCKKPWLNLCAATEDSNCEQPFISADDDHTNRFIVAFTSQLNVRQSFTNFARQYTTSEGQLATAGGFEPLQYVPPSKEHPPLLLAWYSDHKTTAGIRVYNFTTGVPLLDVPVTSANGNSPIVTDIDRDGFPDIIAGTFAPSNGLRTATGLSDDTSYLLGFSWNGDFLWEPVKLGGAHTEAVPILVNEGDRSYVVVRQALDAPRAALTAEDEPPQGTLSKFDAATGKEVAMRFEHNRGFLSHSAAKLSDKGPEMVLVTDDEGWLHTFDAQLAVVRRVPVAPKGTNSWSDLKLVGVADLDGDGRREIVLQGAVVEAKRTVNWAKPGDPANDWTFHDCSVYVLDADSRLLAKHVFSEKRGLSQGTTVLLAPRKNGTTEILVLKEEVSRFQFSRKPQRTRNTLLSSIGNLGK